MIAPSPRDRLIAPLIGLGTLLLHLATASRYGYFRDELYFIACSKHLAAGFVDQPPGVAIAAWLTSPFGYNLIALRFLPALASALAVFLAVRIAADLGGQRFAQLLAGISVALLPAYLSLGNTLTTTSFEAFTWTLAIYCTLRIVRNGSAKWWIGLGGGVALGLLGKYSIALLVIALLIGLLATRERRVLWTPWMPIACAISLLIILPNLLWQASHAWPMLEVLQGDAAHRHSFNNGMTLEYQSLANNTIAFALEQLLYTGPIAAIIWLVGIVAPFRMKTLLDIRFVSVAFIVLFAIAAALGAKGYYIIGIYAALVAVGSVAIETAVGWVRVTALVAVAAVSVIAMPISLPVLSLPQFLAYSQLIHLTGTPPALAQPIYAEEFGWDRLASDVARVYDALPAAQRARTAIYADTYADAGAIDFFGPRYGIPSAISSQNTYYLWGTHGYDGSSLIAIGATRIDILRKYYRNVRLITTSNEPLKQVVEGPNPIYLCTDPTMPLDQIWPHLRWYGA